MDVRETRWASCSAVLLVTAALLTAPATPRADEFDAGWDAYLDQAHVFVSDESEPMRQRLADYADGIGEPLGAWLERTRDPAGGPLDDRAERQIRRRAVALLLEHLSTGEAEPLRRSAATVRKLRPRLGRYENRFWFHYVLAHEALHWGKASAFVEQLLALWLRVVVPLEGVLDESSSPDQTPTTGFARALPFVYENTARLLLVHAPQARLDGDLDPLGAIVRLLADGRVGAFPETIPTASSSLDYLGRVVERLEGPESDGGSLTFTLALLAADRSYAEAHSDLARDGFSRPVVDALRAVGGLYRRALARAKTAAGRGAVHRHALRHMAAIYRAQQGLGADLELENPVSVASAIEVYAELHAARDGGWRDLGYRTGDRDTYLRSMRELWTAIQLASLDGADYYMTRALERSELSDTYSERAFGVYIDYLAFFERFARRGSREDREVLPDSAYFGAFEAARGAADAQLAPGSTPSRAEIQVATEHYRKALEIFPLAIEVWHSLAGALERQGADGSFIAIARTLATRVTASRELDTWVRKGAPEAGRIDALRRLLAEPLALPYLGFADASDVDRLESELAQLEDVLASRRQRIAELERRRDDIYGRAEGAIPAAPASEADQGEIRAAPELVDAVEEIMVQRSLVAKLERQISARSRALPVYRRALESSGLSSALRAGMDHPAHALVRAMYHEDGS